MPVFGVISLVTTAVSGIAIATSVRNGAFPPSIALLPLVLPSAIGVLMTKHALWHSFGASTHCGPAPWEVLVVGTQAEVMLYQLVPIVVAALGVLCVGVALLPTVRRFSRLGFVAAVFALAGSFLATALATVVVRKATFSISSSESGGELALLLAAITRWRVLAKTADGLLVAALLLGLGSAIGHVVKGRAASGVLNLLFLAALSVAVRGASALDERLSNDWQMGAVVFPGAVRTNMRLARTLKRDPSRFESPLLRSGLEYGSGPWGLVVGEADALEPTLSLLLTSGVRRVVLLSPVAPPLGVPRPFRPAAKLYSAVHDPAPVSLRFDDEPPCGASAKWVGTGLGVEVEGEAAAQWNAPEHHPPIDDAVWNRLCVDLGPVSAATPAELSLAVSTAYANARRVVVSVSRTVPARH